MQRHRRLWIPEDEPGIEDVQITLAGGRIAFEGVLVRLWQGQPLSVNYHLVCNSEWHVHEFTAEAQSEAAGARAVHLRGDGAGAWQDAAGQPIPELRGCIDVDFMLTPLTNTLPILRLGLAPGESRAINVVYIAAPELDVTPFAQRYTRLDDANGLQYYRYESLVSGFTAVLPVDDAGFVIDYPGIWRRLWPTT